MTNYEVLHCYHCSNTTAMKLANSYIYEYEEILDEEWNHYYHHRDIYKLYICLVCHNATIDKEHSNNLEVAPNGEPYKTSKCLYPVAGINFENLPKNISKSYEVAIKSKNIDNVLTAIALRRILEMLCKNKGATKGNLYEKLKKLAEENILPSNLKDMATILRNIGNIAAHADDFDFNDSTMEYLWEFTETILMYIYELPIKIEETEKQWKLATNKSRISK